MQCEICGVEIIGSARKVVVEGTELDVCGRCSQYGKAPQGWIPVSRKVAPVVAATPKPKSGMRKTKRRSFDDMDDEIVSDYSRIIRDAREAKGWTLEELGLNIKEKAALIRKIERSEIKPVMPWSMEPGSRAPRLETLSKLNVSKRYDSTFSNNY
jgi:putative transcription factor